MKLRRKPNAQSVIQDWNKLKPVLQKYIGAAWEQQTIRALTKDITDTILGQHTQTQAQAIYQYLISRQGETVSQQGLMRNAWRIAGNKHLLRLSNQALKQLDTAPIQDELMQIKIQPISSSIIDRARQLSYRPHALLNARVYTGPLAGSVVSVYIHRADIGRNKDTFAAIGGTRRLYDIVRPLDIVGTFMCIQAFPTDLVDCSTLYFSNLVQNVHYVGQRILSTRKLSTTSFMKKYNRALWVGRNQYKNCQRPVNDRPSCGVCTYDCPLAGAK